MGTEEEDASVDTVPEPEADADVTRAAAGRRGPRSTDPEPSINPRDGDLPSLEHDSFTARYDQVEVLGRGGMGEVRLTRDRHIGRDIALKVMHESWRALNDSALSRFLREARVQGRLEHPSIVPVYDLGIDDAGHSYFTMKRVRGVTLSEVFKSLRTAGDVTADRFTQRKLLNVFVQVCQAVHYAHEQGVIHRDLKPANIMLGDFGEVYVLDWGLAKVRDVPDESQQLYPEAQERLTRADELLGTPGYMAPEQIADAEAVDARADVYALGAMLFELLTHQRMHGGEGMRERLVSTMGGERVLFADRAPDCDAAPELETICLRATEPDLSERYESAGQFYAAIDEWLEGTRDDELRKRLAEEHAEAAAAEAATLLVDESESERRRKATMQHISRALAFDPMNSLALKTLLRVLTEMPRYTTKATRVEYAQLANEKVREAMGVASRAYVAWLITFPLMLWMGVRDTKTCGALFALAVLTATSAYACSQLERVGAALQYGVFMLSCVTLGIGSSWFGPLMLVPSAVAVNTLGFAMTDVTRRRYAFVSLGLATILVPTVLQAVGVVPASYAFVGGELHVLPRLTDMPEAATMAALVFTSLATIAVSSLSAGHLRGRLAEAEQKLLNFTWHLRQLLPTHVLEEVE